MTWKCQGMPNGSLPFEVNQLVAASVSTGKFILGLPGNQLQLWVSEKDPLKLDSSPIPYSLNLSLVVHRLWWEQRERGRENLPSFFPHHSLHPPCALRRGLGTIQPLIACVQMPYPPPLRKNQGERLSFRFFSEGPGGGRLYTCYTITIWYNVLVVE